MIDGFRAEKDRETARADRAEQALTEERTRSEALSDRLNAVEATAKETQQAAEVHQDRLRAEVDSIRAELAAARRTEDERKGRGLLGSAQGGVDG
jgi:ribosomal protein L16 Arg81 hydroxylase